MHQIVALTRAGFSSVMPAPDTIPMKTHTFSVAVTRSVIAVLMLLLLNAFVPSRALGADGLVDKTKTVASDATEAVKDAGRTVADKATEVWKRIDDAMLKHRNRDEMVAWAIMGVLVGALAGMMASSKSSGAGKFGRLLLAVVGAFLGGIAVRALRVDFGWGPVLIRYEELCFSLAGAVVLVVVGKMIRGKAKKQPDGKESAKQ